jgi:hypothetical protein
VQEEERGSGARVALREAMDGRGGVGLDLDSVRR